MEGAAVSFRERVADTLLGAFKPAPFPPPLPTSRRPQIEADIANTMQQLNAYVARGIKHATVISIWAAGFSVEQVERRAKELGEMP